MVGGFGNDWMMARLQLQQALISLEVGDLGATERFVHTALETFVRMGQRPDVAPVLDTLGFLAIAAQSEAKAVRCFAAADVLRAKLEIVAWPPDAASVGDACDGLRAVLGEETFAHHWDKGAALNLDEAVEYVSRSPRT